MNIISVASLCAVFLIALSRLCLADIEPVSVADPTLAASVSGNDFSTDPEMSPDGRYVVFSSFSNNLATNDDNYCVDVFLRDRQLATTTLISANTDGGGANGPSVSPSMSTNGTWIAFQSDADDLVSGDTNRTTDVFIRNTPLGLTALVSINTNGVSANGASTFPIITPDGRFVAFESMATDLVTNNSNAHVVNVYLRDLSSNTTVLASVSTNGLTGGDSDSKLSCVSPDGRYVLFTSSIRYYSAPNNTRSDVFLRDIQTRQTYWVSSNMLQSLGSSAAFFNPVMSDDGQHIAFRATMAPMAKLVVRYDLSSNTSLVVSSNFSAANFSNWDYPGPSISEDGSVVAYMDFTSAIEPGYLKIKQVYVWDSTSNTNVLATVAPDGTTAGNADSISPVLSADGRTLTFLSRATNLDVNVPATSRNRIYTRNLVTGVTKLAGSEKNTNKPQGDDVEDPVLSADGSLVAFGSSSDGLVDGDNNNQEDVFVGNVQSGLTELISSKLSTIQSMTASASSIMPEKGMSSDARFVVFSTAANNLAVRDTNLQSDVYVRDMATGKIQLVSGNANGTGAGNGASTKPSISADGHSVAFQSTASDLVASDANGQCDVFIRDLVSGQTRLVSARYNGTDGATGISDNPTITPDGRFVVFRTTARDLRTTPVSDPSFKAYAYEVASGSNYMLVLNGKPITNPILLAISPDSRYAALFGNSGATATAFNINDLSTHVSETIMNVSGLLSGPTAFSGDGRWLSFQTVSSHGYFMNLYDQAAKTNKVIADGKWRLKISLSGDGSRVAYDQIGTLTMPTNKRQIFVFDTVQGSNILVSANLTGTNGGNADSRNPIISPDGRYVYFNSRATDLVEDSDLNGTTDVFVRDLTTGTTRLLSVNRFKTGTGNNLSVLRALSADGQVVSIESFASDLTPMDLNMTKDVFVLRVNATVEDTDNDGLPDGWETKYFGNLGRDGKGDYDSDGMSDGAEYLAGTDPTDKQSMLRVTQIGKPSETGRLITWTAIPGKTYKIQFKTHLNDAAWEALEGTVKAEDVTASKADDTTNGAEQRFYRVLLVP